MRLIYLAKDITEAHIVAGLLKSNGIEAHVGGHYLQGGVGELAAMDFATVNVADEDIEAAKRIIAEYEKNNIPSSKKPGRNRSKVIAPLIILSITIVMMLLLAVAFSDYK